MNLTIIATLCYEVLNSSSLTTIVLEFKLKGKETQYRVIDEMIRTAQFVRHSTLRYWMDNQGVKLADLYK